MGTTNANTRLTVDIAALQRLPESSPAPEGAAMLGIMPQFCSLDWPTCCCTRLTDL